MYNKIWKQGQTQNTWKYATTPPLLKKGKDQKDVRS